LALGLERAGASAAISLAIAAVNASPSKLQAPVASQV
jgi:hypothetical protein